MQTLSIIIVVKYIYTVYLKSIVTLKIYLLIRNMIKTNENTFNIILITTARLGPSSTLDSIKYNLTKL